MSDTWTPATIEVSTIHGMHPVATERRGVWAVHRTVLDDLSQSERRWSLTHAPTGRSAVQGLCSADAAKRLADALEPLNDWAAYTRADINSPMARRLQRRVWTIAEGINDEYLSAVPS